MIRLLMNYIVDARGPPEDPPKRSAMIASLTYLLTYLFAHLHAYFVAGMLRQCLLDGSRAAGFFLGEQSPPTAAESIIAGQRARSDYFTAPAPAS